MNVQTTILMKDLNVRYPLQCCQSLYWFHLLSFWANQTSCKINNHLKNYNKFRKIQKNSKNPKKWKKTHRIQNCRPEASLVTYLLIIATLAPRADNAFTIPWPRPVPPPVTKAIFPSKVPLGSIKLLRGAKTAAVVSEAERVLVAMAVFGVSCLIPCLARRSWEPGNLKIDFAAMMGQGSAWWYFGMGAKKRLSQKGLYFM